MTHAIKIRTNTSATSSVPISDLGFDVPVWTGSNMLVFTDDEMIAAVTQSEDVAALSTDNAFPASSDLTPHSLVLFDENDVLIPPGSEDAHTEPVFIGATPSADGSQGLVPQPRIADVTPVLKFVAANGQWAVPAGIGDVVGPAGGVVDGEIVVYDGTTGKVIRASGVLLDYAGRVEKSPPILVSDCPTNKWIWWWDTTNSLLYKVRNRAGTLYGVEASPF